MWSMQSEDLAGARGLRGTVAVDSHPATFAEVITAWQGDSVFRSQFNAFLAGSPYAAFRWETPAVTVDTVNVTSTSSTTSLLSLASRAVADTACHGGQEAATLSMKSHLLRRRFDMHKCSSTNNILKAMTGLVAPSAIVLLTVLVSWLPSGTAIVREPLAPQFSDLPVPRAS